MANRILVIDDDYDMCLLLQRFLEKNGYEVVAHHKGQKGIAAYQEKRFDAVICDYRLGDADAIQVIRSLQQVDPHVIVIVITGYSNTRIAVEIMKLGAHDYISKPLIPEEVLAVLKHSLLHKPDISLNTSHEPDAPVVQKTSSPSSYYEGKSPAMLEVYSMIDVVAPTNYNVILYGESGTGKEVAARLIHDRSLRRNRPFVAIDCGILSRELAASELFGHIKGSFTGAIQDREGHFAVANGGTLFLDEVANLPSEVQSTLLRVIQERRFKPVGSTREMPADVRIIVASNESLQEAYQRGKFREDLYHRFNEFMIPLPPLRERREDIVPLANLFMQIAGVETNSMPSGFDRSVYPLLKSYSWPGNIRELRNVIRRAVLLTPAGEAVMPEALPEVIVNPGAAPAFESGTQAQDRLADGKTVDGFLSLAEPVSEQDLVSNYERLKGAANKAEFQTILQALKQANFNKKKAAAILKIDRKTLYNKLKNFQMRYSS